MADGKNVYTISEVASPNDGRQEMGGRRDRGTSGVCWPVSDGRTYLHGCHSLSSRIGIKRVGRTLRAVLLDSHTCSTPTRGNEGRPARHNGPSPTEDTPSRPLPSVTGPSLARNAHSATWNQTGGGTTPQSRTIISEWARGTSDEGQRPSFYAIGLATGRSAGFHKSEDRHTFMPYRRSNTTVPTRRNTRYL